jgi:prophage antirepressor-like protein
MEIVSHQDFGNLRVLTVGDEPWFCANDLAQALRYKRPRDAAANHVRERHKCSYETLRKTLSDSGQPPLLPEMHPHTVFVNEAGMYSLIMGSRIEAAEDFKDYVCTEVLPAIRKHGRYFAPTVRNELELHTAVCQYARSRYPLVRITPGLGELQDTSEKRIVCYRKGYQGGQPDLILHARSGQFSGLALELKTPKGDGVLRENQREWLEALSKAGYKTVVSSSLDECTAALNSYMANVRICCQHCGGSFKNDKTLAIHMRLYHCK